MEQTIIVTGGAGYIGSHTVVELQNSGYQVAIIDDLSNSNLKMLGQIEKITGKRPVFFEFDLCDFQRLDQCLAELKNPVAIIHFAAKKAVGESVEKPLLYYRTNIQSLLNLLELMPKYGIPNFVFSSSCTVYGQPEQLPVNEQTPFQPAASPYGNTKQVCEEILLDTARAQADLQVISLRYFNPVGAHDTALIGELPTGVPNNLVPFITQTAAGIRKELKVFGSDYNTPDGTAIRDYIHIVDLAQAHVVALERLLANANEKSYEFFNLGTGKGSSVLEVVNAFESATRVPLNYRIVERRPGDVEQIYADTTLANQVLGWKAQRGLEDMMRTAWKWQTEGAGKLL
ncbi:MAG: UDP-glucose 4-epimerase GalE [Bacteroidota bacterium]